MRRFITDKTERSFLAILEPEKIERSLNTFGSKENSCCIKCDDVPCITFHTPGASDDTTMQVCPTDAIKIKPDGGVSIGDGCISCGICAIICPVAAIEVRNGEIAVVIETRPELVEVVPNREVFLELRNSASQFSKFGDDEIRAIAKRISDNSVTFTQKSFYGLTAALFRCLGVETFLPPQGDTNNRIDLILTHSNRSIAVEVKSATETRSINIKSIQQALENKIVLDERKFFQSTVGDSSLVVGFSYPTQRSGVQELIYDISKTYGINIGIISIEDLYIQVLQLHLNGKLFDRNVLTTLYGKMK